MCHEYSYIMTLVPWWLVATIIRVTDRVYKKIRVNTAEAPLNELTDNSAHTAK